MVGVQGQGGGEGADIRDHGGGVLQRRGGREEGELGNLAVRGGGVSLKATPPGWLCEVALNLSKAHHLTSTPQI